VQEGVLALTKDGRLLPQLSDSTAVVAALSRGAVADSILVRAARVLDLDREPEYLELAANNRTELLGQGALATGGQVQGRDHR